MLGMAGDNRHHTLSEPRGNPHLRTFAADRQVHLVALFLAAHQGLKLLGVHEALFTQRHNDIVLLHTGFLRGAAIHHVIDDKTKAFRQAKLGRELGRDASWHDAEISHRPGGRCLGVLTVFPVTRRIRPWTPALSGTVTGTARVRPATWCFAVRALGLCVLAATLAVAIVFSVAVMLAVAVLFSVAIRPVS